MTQRYLAVVFALGLLSCATGSEYLNGEHDSGDEWFLPNETDYSSCAKVGPFSGEWTDLGRESDEFDLCDDFTLFFNAIPRIPSIGKAESLNNIQEEANQKPNGQFIENTLSPPAEIPAVGHASKLDLVADKVPSNPFGLDLDLTEFSAQDFVRFQALGLKTIVGEVTVEHFRRFREMLPDLEQVAAHSHTQLVAVLTGKLDYLGNLAYSVLLEIYASKAGSYLLEFLCTVYSIDVNAHAIAISKYLGTALDQVRVIKGCYMNEYRALFAIYPSIDVVKLFYPKVSQPNKKRIALDMLKLDFDENNQSLAELLLDLTAVVANGSLDIAYFMTPLRNINYSPEEKHRIKARNEKLMKLSQSFDVFSRADTIRLGSPTDLSLLDPRRIGFLLGPGIDYMADFMSVCSVIWDRMEESKDIRGFWINFSAKYGNNTAKTMAKFIANPEGFINLIEVQPKSTSVSIMLHQVIHYARNFSMGSYGRRFMVSFLNRVHELLLNAPPSELDKSMPYIPQVILWSHECSAAELTLKYITLLLRQSSSGDKRNSLLSGLRSSPLWLEYDSIFLELSGDSIRLYHEIWIGIFNRILFNALITDKKPVLDAIKNHASRTDLMSFALATGTIPTRLLTKFFDCLCDWSAFDQQSLATFLKSLISNAQSQCPKQSIPYGLSVGSLMELLSDKVRK